MTTERFTKAQRKEIRRLAGLAHERELGAAAGQLGLQFERWRRGEIDVFALNQEIHLFHDGVSRDLYKSYVMGCNPEWSVASAIARDVLNESEIDPLILQGLGGSIELARESARKEG
jgi:hypothetical protein